MPYLTAVNTFQVKIDQKAHTSQFYRKGAISVWDYIIFMIMV